MPRLPRLTAVFAGALLCAAFAAAADGFVLFERFRADARLVKINFAQTNRDDSGAVAEESRGAIWFRAPHYFRMEYDAADKPVVIANGVKIWYYEADLRQVIVRPFSARREAGLLAVLSGDGLAALNDRYIFTSGAADGMVWLNGEALKEDDTLRRVRLGFDKDGALRRLDMTDSFGGELILRVTMLERGGEDGDLFSFTAPAGTDVVNLDN